MLCRAALLALYAALHAVQSSAGSLQSLCWGAFAVGQVATAYLSGSLVRDHGPRWVQWVGWGAAEVR